MTLNLSIIKSPEGASLATTQKTFAEQGGTIGRGEGNDWVLSDPERFLSSKHCSLSFEAGQYYLTDTSTNGTFVNSNPEPLGKGGQTAINNGDTVAIGDYQFRVELSNGAGSPAANPFAAEAPLENDPFADDDDPFTISGRVPPENFSDPFANKSTPEPAPDPFGSDNSFGADPLDSDFSLGGDYQSVDPLDMLNDINGNNGSLGQQPSIDPFSNKDPLVGGDPFATDAAPADGIIPANIDDILSPITPSSQQRDDFASTGTQGHTSNAIDGNFELPEVKNQKDSLIPDNWDEDFLSGADANAPLEPAQHSESVAPPQAQTPPTEVQISPTIPPFDMGLEEPTAHQEGFVGEPYSSDPAPAVESLPDIPAPQIGEQLLDERQPERPLPIEPAPVPPSINAQQIPEHVNNPRATPQQIPRQAAPAQPAPVEAQAQTIPSQTQQPQRKEVAQAAGEALLDGLGLSDKNLSADQIEAVYASIGELMPVIVNGMMQVLRSRASIKNEFRMNVTTIQPIENNPLKFSANAFEAIDTMFAKKSSAYMGPKQAFQEGFDGISEHQVAIIAGIREAFKSMMDRFDPQMLEKQFEKQNKGVILPGMQKAKFWSSYVDYYKGFVDNMENTFQYLFGDEFVQAYEDQLRRLAVERKQKQKLDQ